MRQYQLSFLPFVGKNYLSGGVFGKRVMVLGDSHYGSNPTPNITQDVIRYFLDPSCEREGWMNTYTKFERSMVNKETSMAESATIWNSLLFYNYVQELMSGPREAPTKEQYAASADAFFEVLEKYRPEVIIVWGKRLWENLPNAQWEDGERVLVDDYEVDNGYYCLNNGHKVRAFCVYHPSASYSWDYWHRVIKLFV